MGSAAPFQLSDAGSLVEAAEVVVAALGGPAPQVWLTEGGRRRLLAGSDERAAHGADEPAVARSASGAQLEVVGGPSAAAAAAALAAVADRLEAEARADQVARQLAATEQLGGLGSYDWDVVEDRLTWSDELFRIYGHEPGDFEPSYEVFLARVHPDDRERIAAIHREAVRSATPFETEERVLRSDGQVRTLVTNGMVLTDGAGRPARLHGVCRDVTAERAAREHARRASLWFETLVEAAPDAIVVVDAEGRITAVNPQAERFFGHAPGTLTGRSVDELLPAAKREHHAALREGFAGVPVARPMAAGTDLEALRADGTLVPVDIALTPLEGETHGLVAAFVRDASLRRQAELDRRQLADAQLRRRQALELNDNVVQGLVALLWELDEGQDPARARRSAERTLSAARRMMSDLLEALPSAPGSLVRTSQLSPVASPSPTAAPDGAPTADRDEREPAGTTRVVIADDADDLRQLLRLRLDRLHGVEVVAEATNGREAVEQCELHRPDIVVLDLSMPELDGLEAAERIRDRVPDTAIYVLSGYPATVMRERALQAGADAYYEKGGTLADVCDAVAAAARN